MRVRMPPSPLTTPSTFPPPGHPPAALLSCLSCLRAKPLLGRASRFWRVCPRPRAAAIPGFLPPPPPPPPPTNQNPLPMITVPATTAIYQAVSHQQQPHAYLATGEAPDWDNHVGGGACSWGRQQRGWRACSALDWPAALPCRHCSRQHKISRARAPGPGQRSGGADLARCGLWTCASFDFWPMWLLQLLR